MSSGHTGKSGRGNRRARRGSQRPRGQEGPNSQPHSSSAMLILSSGGRQPPAHPERERSPDDEDAALEEGAEAGSADDELSMSGEVPDGAAGIVPGADPSADAPQARSDTRSDRSERAEQQRLAFAPPGGGRGPHERVQPYAPGMRPQAPTSPFSRPRGLPPEHSDGTVLNVNGHKERPAGEQEASDAAAWQDRDMATAATTRETSGIPSRWTRAEHEEHGEHAPLRPEVRGEVGPLIDSLRGLFERDRAIASQGGTTRCGICYLHYALVDLEYREEEGFYVCRACARSLGSVRLPMVRRQQRA